jgi:hypothetical protein
MDWIVNGYDALSAADGRAFEPARNLFRLVGPQENSTAGP